MKPRTGFRRTETYTLRLNLIPGFQSEDFEKFRERLVEAQEAVCSA